MLSSPPTIASFIKLLRKKNNKNICEVLMNQSIVSGVGNYIKAESLWLSRIYPFASVEDLTDIHLSYLYYAILFVIKGSYSEQGATLKTYYTFDNEVGSYANKLYVYGKQKDWHGLHVTKKTTPDKRTTHFTDRQIYGKTKIPREEIN